MVSKPPARLYKYQRIDSYNLTNLRNNEFFFRAPSQFNDPYDCALDLQLDIEKLADDDVLRKALVQDPDFSERFRELAVKDVNATMLKSYRDALPESMRAMFNLLQENVRSRLKVTCLSAKHDNMLMWSHYADAGKGFCLEFDAHHPSFERKLNKVRYVREFPKLDPLTMNHSRRDAVQEIFNAMAYTKSEDWIYEQEWRIISMEESATVEYDPEILKGIYFGTRVDNDEMFSVIKAAQESGTNPKFYQGHPSKREFKIEFSEIENLF